MRFRLLGLVWLRFADCFSFGCVCDLVLKAVLVVRLDLVLVWVCLVSWLGWVLSVDIVGLVCFAGCWWCWFSGLGLCGCAGCFDLRIVWFGSFD